MRAVDTTGIRVSVPTMCRVGRRLGCPRQKNFSPLQSATSKITTFLRTAKARTREALELAIQQALTTITAVDAHGWFTYCG